jgi:hypothetical protein
MHNWVLTMRGSEAEGLLELSMLSATRKREKNQYPIAISYVRVRSPLPERSLPSHIPDSFSLSSTLFLYSSCSPIPSSLSRSLSLPLSIFSRRHRHFPPLLPPPFQLPWSTLALAKVISLPLYLCIFKYISRKREMFVNHICYFFLSSWSLIINY